MDTKLAVTFNDSTHRLGDKSNFGKGVVNNVDSVLIVDYETFSKICLWCSAMMKN